MFYLNKLLEKHGNIDVSIVGTGLMGTSLITQLSLLDNFRPAIVSSRHMESVISALDKAGISKDKIKTTNNLDQAKLFYEEGYYVATENIDISAALGDCVVDCTGDTEVGAKISLRAIENKVNIVSLNVEMDATVGPILKKMADEAGIVYSGTAGDEPGAIIGIYEFAKFAGFEVLALCKGKNNKLNNYATVESLTEEARGKGLNPRMLTSFVDGTNTMMELNAVCNATGFVPDVRGCHFFNTSRDTIAKDIDLKENGSKLNSYGIVDFASGVAPGVFAIVRAKDKIIENEMKFLLMGDGPNFAIYRPYHLTSIETPISIARAVLMNDSTIAPDKGSIAETISVAKRDIKKGENIEGIGSNDVFGQLEKKQIQKDENLLPIGLLVGKVVAKRDIKKSQAISYDDVELDPDSVICELRRQQDKLIID
jgi:predicted homoserine dehydrogenase-like protein